MFKFTFFLSLKVLQGLFLVDVKCLTFPQSASALLRKCPQNLARKSRRVKENTRLTACTGCISPRLRRQCLLTVTWKQQVHNLTDNMIRVYSSHESISSHESSSSHESGSSQAPIFFCFLFFVFDYTDDVRAVTRNINFLVGDIFHSRSKEPLLLRIAVASPRYTTTFNINTFSKNIKASNLHIPEEHAPFTWYTGKTDGERSQSQAYLTFAPEPSWCVHREPKINTIDSNSSRSRQNDKELR